MTRIINVYNHLTNINQFERFWNIMPLLPHLKPDFLCIKSDFHEYNLTENHNDWHSICVIII